MNTIGLSTDPDKIVVRSPYLTFCSLCQRKVERYEDCYTWEGSQFVVHLNCELAKDRMHVVEFRKLAKNKGKARKGKKSKKTVAAQNPERGVARSHGRGWRDIR